MKFSCIIPAYNEGPRIGNVLNTVLSCELLDEVIVINDGSTDNTQDVLDTIHHSKLTIIQQKNSGKTRAFFTGVESSIGEYIVMIDADLLHLKGEHIVSLISPIIEKKSDITLSLRENSLLFYKFLRSDFVSGERVIPRTLFQDIGYYTSGPGFSLEVKMNKEIRIKKLQVTNIYLPGVISPRKSIKIGYIQGFFADIKMIGDILQGVSVGEIFKQVWYFSWK